MNTLKTTGTILGICLLGCTLFQCSDDEDEPKGNFMEVVSINPESPASLNFNDNVQIVYEYNIEHEDGARMWVIPQTNGDDSPGYRYSSSGVFNGSGDRGVIVSIADQADPVIVDQLWVIMKDPDQSEILYSEYIDVEYTYGQ